MRGFGSFDAARRFGRACDELRQFERYRRVRAETGSRSHRRQQCIGGRRVLRAMLLAVYHVASFRISTSQLGGKELRIIISDATQGI